MTEQDLIPFLDWVTRAGKRLWFGRLNDRTAPEGVYWVDQLVTAETVEGWARNWFLDIDRATSEGEVKELALAALQKVVTDREYPKSIK